MKKIISLAAAALLFSACSSNLINLNLVDFKDKVENIQNSTSGTKVRVADVQINRQNLYSTDFANTTLRLRIDQELDLLSKKLKEQTQRVLISKGYVIDNSPSTALNFSQKINVVVKESNVQQGTGGEVDARITLELTSEAHLTGTELKVVNGRNTQVKTDASAVAKGALEPTRVNYTPSKNAPKSTVATQLGRGEYRTANEIDKILIKFYDAAISNLQTRIPDAK